MIGVIGLGFVGLTTALGFSDKGIPTLGYDINEHKTEQIKAGEIPFFEPGLKDALSRNINNCFRFSNSVERLVSASEVIFICVGTPQGLDGKADINQVKSSIENIISHVKPREKKLVLIKSTVPPTTTDSIQGYVNDKINNESFEVRVGVNPEFLREGHAWQDFINPDRIVVGINATTYYKDKILKIYRNFNSPVVFTSTNTAEFLKYLSNAMLSTMVSFSNEMSVIANKIGEIDIPEAFNLLHMDKRFSGNPAAIVSYLYPGCGYGGYCLPKDTMAIAKLSSEFGYKPTILEGNLSVNDNIMPLLLNDFFNVKFDHSVHIGILGLSFKPDSDDVRETPAIRCIRELRKQGYGNIFAYDPKAENNFKNEFPHDEIHYSDSPENLIKSVEVIFILTAWKEFADLDFKDKRVYNLRYMRIKK